MITIRISTEISRARIYINGKEIRGVQNASVTCDPEYAPVVSLQFTPEMVEIDEEHAIVMINTEKVCQDGSG